jgi:hypothetical protein
MVGKYEITVTGVLGWANHELDSVGKIASIKDKDVQYSYALSAVNGMAHLKDALDEIIADQAYTNKKDLERTRDQVVRVMKHLIKDYEVDLNTIRNFNTKKILSNLNYLGTANANGNTNANANANNRSVNSASTASTNSASTASTNSASTNSASTNSASTNSASTNSASTTSTTSANTATRAAGGGRRKTRKRKNRR